MIKFKININNKITFCLFLVFALANLIDIITACFILPAESNPLYVLTGNLGVLVMLKVGFVVAVGYFVIKNKFSNSYSYYVIVSTLIFGVLLFSLGAYSNIYGLLNPVIIEEGSAMTGHEKVAGYCLVVGMLYIIPVAINLLIFWIYESSRVNAKIGKKYFKELRWWHI